MRALAVLATLFLISATVQASADEATGNAPGVAYASAFAHVPTGVFVDVRAWDNTKDNERIKMSFAEALNRRGVPLTDRDTALTLNFETEVQSLADGSTAKTRYILRVTLDNQMTGRRLWQAEARYTGAMTEAVRAFAAMAPILIDGFGENLRPEGFRLQ
jgi:hypothetical protein